MKETTAKFAVHAVSERVGIAVTAKVINERDGGYLELAPTDFHRNEGFCVQYRPGWRSAEAILVFGPFSGQLMARMGESDPQAKRTFGVFASALIQKKVKTFLRINGGEVNPLEPEKWPAKCSKIELQLKQTPIVVDSENDAQQERLILDLVVPIFGMSVALIGAEESELPTSGELEGRAAQTLVTRYERSRLNREACIQFKGTRCTVCGFDFAENYGPLGIGYIEIHHLKPVSTIGPDYQIDITTDLTPLCSNCHAIAHREEPPVTIERLQGLVRERRLAKQSQD